MNVTGIGPNFETRVRLVVAIVERGGQPQEGKNFDLHPPPVVSFVGEGKIGIGSMLVEVQWTPLISSSDPHSSTVFRPPQLKFDKSIPNQQRG